MNALCVGRRVYCGLYGGKDGVIFEMHGEPAPASVRNYAGILNVGGRADVSVVWNYGGKSLRVPEAIVMGVQWKVYDEVVGAEEIAALLANSALYEASEKAKADEAAAKFAAAMEAAKAEGVALGLMPEAEFRAAGKRGSAAASNMRAQLKAAGLKARVKQDGYSCINVYPEAGVDRKAVEEIALRYKAGNFDGMSDCYEYSPRPWGKVFGDVQYVFVSCRADAMVL